MSVTPNPEPERNKIKKNNREELEYITDVLKRFYFWPKGDNLDNLNRLFYLKLIIFAIILLIPMLLNIYHAYHFSSDFNYSMVKDPTNILMFIQMLTIGTTFQVFLKDFVKEAKMFSLRNTSPEMAPFYIFRLNYKMIIKAMRYAIFVLTLIITLVRLVTEKSCEEAKIKSGSLETCGLLVPVYLPFDFEFFPLKQLILLQQAVMGYTGFLIFSCVILLPVHYIDKTLGTLNYLIDLLDDLNFMIENGSNLDKYLRKMINIHSVVIRENKFYVQNTGVLNKMCLVFAQLIMATLIFEVLETGSVVALVQFGWWLTVIILYHFAGQLIIDKSDDFSGALYNIKWYKIKTLKDRRSFLLLHLMAQRPLALYAGPFAKISCEELLEILKATYSGSIFLGKKVNREKSS